MSTITDSLKNFYKKLGGSLSNLGPNSTSADIVDAMAEVYTDKEGTYVEVTEEVTEGTKIATITTNNEDHDIYAPVELPAVTSSDEGKVLSVDSNGDWVADDIPDQLPAYSAEDENKILTVNSQGELEFIEFDSENALIIDGTYASTGYKINIDITKYSNWGQASAAIISALTNGKQVLIRVKQNNNENRDIMVPYYYGTSSVTFYNWYASGDVITVRRYSSNSNNTNTSISPGLYKEYVQLPECAATDEGKILGVDEGEWTIIDAPTELPAVTSADEGKVLSVNSNGAWAASTPSSSGGFVDYKITGSGTSFTLADGKKCKDVINDVIAGKNVRLYKSTSSDWGIDYTYYGQTVRLYENNDRLDPGGKTVMFYGFIEDGSALKYYSMRVAYTDDTPNNSSISATVKTITTT